MTDLETFTEMLSRSKIRFKIKTQKGRKDFKDVIVIGRFECDRTMFKFDNYGQLYYVGTFDEPIAFSKS